MTPGRAKTFLFLLVLLVGMAFAPAMNLLQGIRAQGGAEAMARKLYSVDFLLPPVSRLLWRLGISIRPGRAVVGYDDWLFLGPFYLSDYYEESRNPEPLAPARREAVERTLAGQREWERFFRAQGVAAYRIVIAPQKGTIYPEHLPHWARPQRDSGLYDLTRADIYVDVRARMRAAKQSYGQPLYFRTDSHWNSLGAGEAFRALADSLGRVRPDLVWPAPDAFDPAEAAPPRLYDLANFLALMDLKEGPPRLKLHMAPLETVQTDYRTGALLYRGRLRDTFVPLGPMLFRTDKALNAARVLWLRDSFGSDMVPFLSTSFTEILTLHYGALNSEPDLTLRKLVEEWKPDFVVLTVMEPAAAISLFSTPP